MTFQASWKDFWCKYWVYFASFAIILLFYHEILCAKGAWVVADHAEQHFPWAYLLAQSLKQGILPFWTNFIQAGFPLVAEGQIGAFYLPNIIFYTLLPFKTGYAWNIIFHLILSAFFMIKYLESLKLDPRAILLGVLVYMFGSTLGGAYYNITSLKVLTWFPLILLVIDRMIAGQRFRWRWALGLGFLYSLQILAGYLQFAAYAMIFSVFYFCFRWLETRGASKNDSHCPPHSFGRIRPLADEESRRDDVAISTSKKKIASPSVRNDSKVSWWRSGFFSLLTILVAGLIGILISFPQLWLTFELAIRSNRAGMSEAFAYVGSYSPFAFICLLYPSLEGFFVSKLYLGVFPIFFMLVAFYYFREEKRKSFYFLTLLAFLLALGQFSPLYVAIVKVFHLYSLRTPVKLVFFAGFFLSVLAAMGCHRLISSPNSKRVAQSAYTYMIICAVAILAVLGAYFAFQFYPAGLENMGEGLLKKFVYAKAGHPHTWDFYVQKLQGVIQGGAIILRPLSLAIYLPFLKMLTTCFVIFVLIKKRISVIAFLVFAFVLIALDLNFSYSDIRGDYESYRSFDKVNPATKFLQQNLKGERYFVYSQNPSESPLPASKNMLYGLETVNAYSPLVLRDYYDFWGPMGGINDSVSYQTVDDDYLISHLNLLRMMNVRYVVTDRNLQSDALPQVFQDRGWRIYEVQSPMPKFFLGKNYRVVNNRKEILEKLREPSFDPVQIVYLDDNPVFRGEKDPDVSHNRITQVMRTPNQMQLTVDCSEDQILVFSQTYYPGWTVEIDGAKYPLARCNYILSAIPLAQGHHTLIVRYRPFSRQ